MFDHLAPVLERGARVFGATIVQGNAPRSMPAQALMNLYNSKGIFSNAADTVEDLHAALCRRFRRCRGQPQGHGGFVRGASRVKKDCSSQLRKITHGAAGRKLGCSPEAQVPPLPVASPRIDIAGTNEGDAMAEALRKDGAEGLDAAVQQLDFPAFDRQPSSPDDARSPGADRRYRRCVGIVD